MRRLLFILLLFSGICYGQIGRFPIYIPAVTSVDTGIDTIKFTSVQPATLNQVSIIFQTVGASDKIYLDWGEDAVVEVSGTTDQTKTSDYSTNNTTYNIKIYGDLSKLKKLNINSEGTVQGVKSSELANCTNLSFLRLSFLGTSGHDIHTSDLADLPLTDLQLLNLGTSGHVINSSDLAGKSLVTLQLYSLGTTGHSINTADFAGMPLTYFQLYNMGTSTCTGQVSDLPTTLTDFIITQCGTGISITSGTMKAWSGTSMAFLPSGTGYTTAQIDEFLNDWAAVAGTGTKTIDLRGANQARSSASDAAVSTLTGLGKTIQTNP